MINRSAASRSHGYGMRALLLCILPLALLAATLPPSGANAVVAIGNDSDQTLSQLMPGACATPGKDGHNARISGVVNTYYPGTASVAAGATEIPVDAPRGSTTPISAGDLLLVIQMQDATIRRENGIRYGNGRNGRGVIHNNQTGLYEYVVAAGAIEDDRVPIRGRGPGNGLIHSYTAADGTTTHGQRRFQVVRVPQYGDATLDAAVTALPWDGRSGGIVALDIAGALALNNQRITADGLGFRGGGGRAVTGGAGGSIDDYVNLSSNPFHGSKGEGTAGTPRYIFDAAGVRDTMPPAGTDGYPLGSTARGAPGIAGGGGTDGNPLHNDVNSGGGGGGGAGGSTTTGTGGAGGGIVDPADPGATLGGIGGAAFGSVAPGRVVPGGGGGAGSADQGGTASSGAVGGGIVLIRAGRVTESGVISANGQTAAVAYDDGAGGGGGGGSIVVWAGDPHMPAARFEARGGHGGAVIATNSAAWPGGGGGGGYVAVSGATAGIDVDGGAAGVSNDNAANNAEAGRRGRSLTTLTADDIAGAQAGAWCTVDLDVTFDAAYASAPAGDLLRYTATIANHGRLSATDVIVSHRWPASLLAQQVSPSQGTCDESLTCALGTIAPGATTKIEIVARPTRQGTISFSSTARAREFDSMPDNNGAEALLTVLPARPTEILWFTAEPRDGLVVLRWETAAEPNTTGFDLWRSANDNHDDATRLTTTSIPAQGDRVNGAQYSWNDTTAAPGTTYTYWLVVTEIDDSSRAYTSSATLPPADAPSDPDEDPEPSDEEPDDSDMHPSPPEDDEDDSKGDSSLPDGDSDETKDEPSTGDDADESFAPPTNDTTIFLPLIKR